MVYQIYSILENVTGNYTKIKELHESTETKKSKFRKLLDEQLASAQQQIEDRKRQKQAYTETCNRDLQQLHKDEERLLNLIEVVKNK